MADHPNVVLIRRWFEATAAGDLQTAVETLSPTLRYYGYDATGERREFRNRDDLFATYMQVITKTENPTTRLVQALPVGDTLVMAHVRVHRSAKQTRDTVDDDVVMAFRIENGQITQGVELCGSAIIGFWKRNGAA
jgi:ketosteroid isomerase-like protein